MSDLLWGFVILALVSAGLFTLGFRLTRNRAGRRLEWLAGCTLLAIVAYVIFLWDNMLMARWLPVSNLIVLGNWYPPFIGFLGGLAWNGIPGSWVKKSFYITGLFSLALFAVVKPLWGNVPKCRDLWVNDVCIQTSPTTCSPACAATILAEASIETTEHEMAELCLTRKGTLWQGLYRGLKLKTEESPWDVQVFVGDIDHLRTITAHGPVILTVGLPKEPVDEIYTERYGWTPGELHSVVLFGFDAEQGSEAQQRANMGDPGVETGREQWSVEDLRILYRGRGLRLVPR